MLALWVHNPNSTDLGSQGPSVLWKYDLSRVPGTGLTTQSHMAHLFQNLFGTRQERKLINYSFTETLSHFVSPDQLCKSHISIARCRWGN